MLRTVRLCLREDVDTIKLNISGDFGTDSAPSEVALMTDAEIATAVETIWRTHAEMGKHGIRIVVRGDYRFAANPQGPTRVISNTSSPTSASHRPRRCRPRPGSAARS